jgi:hypothetical protein
MISLRSAFVIERKGEVVAHDAASAEELGDLRLRLDVAAAEANVLDSRANHD